MSALQFVGVVSFRSSLPNASGPPGESVIHFLNPQREGNICEITGWDRLEPGSLNLSVKEGIIEQLKALKPTWEEDGVAVAYPPPYQRIPLRRGAYLYFLADAVAFGKSHQVLVRTARIALPGRVELYASENLTRYFGVAARDLVSVGVRVE